MQQSTNSQSTSVHRVIEARDVRAFFQESILTSLEKQSLQATEEAVVYLVNMLCDFSRTDQFFESTDEGYSLKPIALLFDDALQADTYRERTTALRRAGDVSLFIAGLFSESLSRKPVDVDYYISMGGMAYGQLADETVDSRNISNLSDVFAELSCQFAEFVDVLGELNDDTDTASNADIMRLYQLWFRTGSARAARKLRKLGVQLSQDSINNARH